ncbi:Fusaric acid resistance protein-like-domain-containing protein [Pisolithus croceorrhizus]|nr:Fusaric acid resistance protein-like-domain-containing protein [Pisolithus croceorrhizus]
MSSCTDTLGRDGEDLLLASSTRSDPALRHPSSVSVGCPDAVSGRSEDGPRTPRVRHTTSLGNIHPASHYPAIEHRSFSYHYPRRRTSAATEQSSPVPGYPSISASGRMRRPYERQWSVFGQLMENEGQLAGPVVHSPRCSGSTERGSWSSSMNPPVHASGSSQLPGNQDATTGDSDSESADTLTRHTATTNVSHWKRICTRFVVVPPLWKSILKCSVAYFLASLFTLHPYLSDFFGDLTSYGPGGGGPSPSGHMIATIAVYYNPAKSMGGMVEADTFCFIAWLYSAFVCLTGMSLFWWLDVQPGWQVVADLVPILWVGFSMWGLSWMKVWMSKPTFNSGSVLRIVKEGGIGTFLQVSSIVLVGALISNLVSFALWPQSATDNFQANMTKTLDSFSMLLGMITDMFLLEEPVHRPSYERMQKAAENHQSTFTGLKKAFAEARSERFMMLDDTSITLAKQAYEDAVDSLTRLAQHLNGLRSGTRLQYELTKAQSEGKLVIRGTHLQNDGNSISRVSMGRGGTTTSQCDDSEEPLLRTAAETFGDLMDITGPPLKALSTTCRLCLKRLREAFVYSQDIQRERMHPQEFHTITDGIERALYTFESTSNSALLRLYRRSDLVLRSRRSTSTIDYSQALGDNENEHIFIVYFFIFTLQEFAGELMCLTDAMRRIYAVESSRFSKQSWWRRCVINRPKSIFSYLFSFQRRSTSEKQHASGLQRISAYFSEHRHPKVSFPKVQPHAPSTVQTPDRLDLSFFGRIKRLMWELGDRLKDRNVKYSFKVGMSTAMLAALAFFDTTRPIFMQYRGEWALVSFFVVMSPTIGATNFLSIHRVLGTLIGAAVAVGVYALFHDSPVVLAIFGFFFSIPCFYYIVAKPDYATSGRFVLLTYNLTCLYSYNLRREDISVLEIARHRSAAVIVGVLWALLVSRFWWPSEARRELSKGLGELCLNMGWLYTRLVASNSGLELDDPEETDSASNRRVACEGTPLLSKSASAILSNSIQEFMAMHVSELHLQIKLIELQGLLGQTQHEPRLKGPFPVLLYRSILTSLQTILDKLHSMRCVTTRKEWCEQLFPPVVRRDFILPVNKERREMAGNIVLYFSVLASALRLKAPLPPYLPPAEEARKRLVDAIRQLDVVKNRDVKASKQLLFFAYALTMKGVTQELDCLGRTLQEAFGVIGQTVEEFDALFTDVDVERNDSGSLT